MFAREKVPCLQDSVERDAVHVCQRRNGMLTATRNNSHDKDTLREATHRLSVALKRTSCVKHKKAKTEERAGADEPRPEQARRRCQRRGNIWANTLSESCVGPRNEVKKPVVRRLLKLGCSSVPVASVWNTRDHFVHARGYKATCILSNLEMWVVLPHRKNKQNHGNFLCR